MPFLHIITSLQPCTIQVYTVRYHYAPETSPYLATRSQAVLNLHAEHRDCHLDLDCEQANVRWYSQGSLSLDKVHRIEYQLLWDLQNVAILHIDSNLCSVSSMAFMSKLTNETIPWVWSLGCRVVILSQIFHRQPGHYTKNLNLEANNRHVDDTNTAMVKLKMENDIYWSHESVLCRGSVTSFWHLDGIHLNSKGQDLFARSLHGALITVFNISWVWLCQTQHFPFQTALIMASAIHNIYIYIFTF